MLTSYIYVQRISCMRLAIANLIVLLPLRAHTRHMLFWAKYPVSSYPLLQTFYFLFSSSMHSNLV